MFLARDLNTSSDSMASMIKITGNGDVFARLFGSVFVWLCFSVLLIFVGALIHLDASLSEIAATIGGFFLVAAGVGWAGRKLSEEQQSIVAGFLIRLIVSGAIIGLAILWWSSWDVPDIWHRPLATLTLSDIGQNVLKLIVFFMGFSFISAVVRTLFSRLRKDLRRGE